MHEQSKVVQDQYFGLNMFQCPSTGQIQTIFSESEIFKTTGLPMYPREQWKIDVERGLEYRNYIKALHRRLKGKLRMLEAKDASETYAPFWNIYYKFPLRDLNIVARLAIRQAWEEKELDPLGYSKEHSDIINGFTFPTYDPHIALAD